MTSADASPRPFRLAARSIVLVFALVALAGVALAWLAPPGARGQEGQDAPGDAGRPAGAPAAGDEQAPSRATPRAALKGFLDAGRGGRFEEAASFLDLSEVDAEPGSAEAAQLARQLEVVLSRTLWIDPALVSDDPAGDTDDDIGPNLERLGEIQTKNTDVPILLYRGVEEDGERAWRFAPYTVAAIPSLYEEHGYGWIEEVLPDPFFEIAVLDVELWQWIGLLVAVALASILGFAAAQVVVSTLGVLARRTRNEWDDWLVESAAGPLRFGFAIAAFWLLSHLLALAAGAQSFVSSTCQALAVVAVTWVVLSVVDVLARVVHRRVSTRDTSVADTLVPMGRRITKGFVIALAVVSLVHNLGFNAAGLLTGLGVGGLAFALAAQKTIENLFGGISVIADKPIEVGQFCKVGEHLGTVEEIGLRSTRLRSLDRTLITIPNAEFSTVRIESYAARDRIRMYSILSIGYDTTPDQMRWILTELRKLLMAHPKVLEGPVRRVRFVAFNAYSLDIEVFAYLDTKDFSESLAIREDVFLRIMDVIEASGAYFAYPSQTLYLGRDAGRDLERSEKAEGEVQSWREGSRLPFPDLPPDEAAALAGTLEYPPEGSAMR